MRQFSGFLIAWCLPIASAFAQSPDSSRVRAADTSVQRPIRIPQVAVMPFSARSVDTEALQGIASALGSSLLRTGKFRVLERSQISQVLGEQGFQQTGACEGSECAVEVGKLLAVDQMVVGSLSRVGNTYSLTARLVNVGTGEVVRSATRNSRGEIDAMVTRVLPLVAKDLAGEPSDPEEDTGEHRSRWGWWVAGGVLVAGGTAAAILLSSGSDKPAANTHVATVSWGN